jgi:hypothetical protein
MRRRRVGREEIFRLREDVLPPLNGMSDRAFVDLAAFELAAGVTLVCSRSRPAALTRRTR